MTGLSTMDTASNTFDVAWPEGVRVIPFDPGTITVIIPTYDRHAILRTTLQRLRRYLLFDGGVRYLVSEDSPNYISSLFGERDIEYVKGPGKGLGANLNFLLKWAETDIVLQMDDDHWLEKPLDINQYVQDLRGGIHNIGWIRLFLGEMDDISNLKGYYKFKAANYGPYWFLDVEGPELYLASNRPHLKLKSFHDHIGYYEEGTRLGVTEESFCHRYRSKKIGQPWDALPWVVIPMFGIQWNQWSHYGDSLQAKGF